MSAPVEYVSVRAFAKLDGCSDKLVRNAINDGKLPVSADGKVDPSLAGTGWRKGNRRAAAGADFGAQVPEKSARTTRRRSAGAKGSAPELDEIDPLELDDEDFVAAVLAGRFRTTGAAERVKENALAVRRLLDARREAGDVVDIEVAEAVLFEQARAIRDAWMNWPSRVGPLIAAELGISPDPVLEALNKYVQQQLQDLGEPDADWAGADEG
jgi:hypothetical protein